MKDRVDGVHTHTHLLWSTWEEHKRGKGLKQLNRVWPRCCFLNDELFSDQRQTPPPPPTPAAPRAPHPNPLSSVHPTPSNHTHKPRYRPPSAFILDVMKVFDIFWPWRRHTPARLFDSDLSASSSWCFHSNKAVFWGCRGYSDVGGDGSHFVHSFSSLPLLSPVPSIHPSLPPSLHSFICSV